MLQTNLLTIIKKKKMNFGNNNNQKQKLDVAPINSETFKSMYCPRCRSDNHSLRTCRQDRFLICFKCGKKDVKYSDCPDCHPEASSETPKN